jgi:hypothetical protein
VPVATATAEEAGTYEVRANFDVLVDLGDRAVVREGDRRILFRLRRPGGWALPVYDWRPEDVRRGWIVRVSTSTDVASIETYAKAREDQYFAAWDVHAMDLHAADMRRRDVREAVRDRVVKIVRDVPLLPMNGFLDFFLGPSDQEGLLPGTASHRWWRRTNQIGRYVQARLLEAEGLGTIETVTPGDGHPRHWVWRPVEGPA